MRYLAGGRTHVPGLLLLSGLSAALVYSALLVWLPLLELYEYPLQNLNSLAPSEWPIGLLLIGCVALLFCSYALGAREALTPQPGRLAPLLIAGFPLIFVALLLFVQPKTSTDVYDYLFRGRMLARYGANVFVRTPQDFADDQLITYVAWRHAVTAYGPLWEGMSWIAARLAGESPGTPAGDPLPQLLRLILAYKGLAILGFLLCGGAIWTMLSRVAPEQRWYGLYLWLWNPLVLWESVAVGHNDVWMALAMVLALWAITRGHSSIGAFLALTAGGLIKFIAFFFGPVLLAAALRELPTWRARLRLIALGGLACAALIALAYVPFWAGWETLRNIGDRRSLFNASWLSALQALLEGSAGPEGSKTIAALLGFGLFLAGVSWATWRAWRVPQQIASHFLWLALWFLFFCNPWFQPWYVIWALALAAIQPWRPLVVWGVGLFCYTALMSYVVAGLLLPALGLSAHPVLREALLSALIYGPPLLTLGWDRLAHPAAIWRVLRRTGALPSADAG